MPAICSFRMICCPAYVSTAAEADPPNSFDSSSSMSFCAPATLPVSTMALMAACWSSENVTPDRASAAIPLMGSFNALPTCIDALFRSIPRACDISRIDCVAVPKFAPLMLVNVASTFSAPRMASSENSDIPEDADIAVAMSPSCVEVSPAAPPVDLITAAVCASAESHCDASSIDPLTKSVTALSALPAS